MEYCGLLWTGRARKGRPERGPRRELRRSEARVRDESPQQQQQQLDQLGGEGGREELNSFHRQYSQQITDRLRTAETILVARKEYKTEDQGYNLPRSF